MKKQIALALLLPLVALPTFGQKNGSSAVGICNGVATGTNITVNIKCEAGVSKAEADRIAQQNLEILQRIRREHLDSMK